MAKTLYFLDILGCSQAFHPSLTFRKSTTGSRSEIRPRQVDCHYLDGGGTVIPALYF
jgi:hypothetical protein